MAFEEKDVEKLVDFVNFISDKAKFEINVKENIKFYGLLSWYQQVLIPKIKDHVLEIKAIHDLPADAEKVVTPAKDKPKASKKK